MKLVRYITLIFLLFLSACQTIDSVKVIKLAHGLDSGHPVHKAMEYMAKLVYERSDGRIRIDLYPSGQLGTERECIELIQIGSLGITKVAASMMEGFVPAFKVFSLPYLFRDDEHRFKVLDGEIGKRLLLEPQKFRIRGLVYYDAGSRSFYTKGRPILAPSDLSGLKIRTMESSTAIKMVQALGGSATPIAWGELYSALQQGVVDGAENNPPSFHLSRHYEVCKHYSLDEHTSIPDILIISTVVWNSLTPEEQQIIQDAANDSEVIQKKLWKEAEEEAFAKLRDAGVTIYHPDKSRFVARVQNMYEEYRSQPEIYNLIQQIKAVQ